MTQTRALELPSLPCVTKSSSVPLGAAHLHEPPANPPQTARPELEVNRPCFQSLSCGTVCCSNARPSCCLRNRTSCCFLQNQSHCLVIIFFISASRLYGYQGQLGHLSNSYLVAAHYMSLNARKNELLENRMSQETMRNAIAQSCQAVSFTKWAVVLGGTDNYFHGNRPTQAEMSLITP